MAEDVVRYEVRDRVAVVTMARPEYGNAQDERMLLALDAAFAAMMADDEVRVVVLSGDGPSFCSGHDLGVIPDAAAQGTEAWLEWEERNYLGLHRRWRDLPKPTIAMVQGACIAGGLMTAWVCDLIVGKVNQKRC